MQAQVHLHSYSLRSTAKCIIKKKIAARRSGRLSARRRRRKRGARDDRFSSTELTYATHDYDWDRGDCLARTTSWRDRGACTGAALFCAFLLSLTRCNYDWDYPPTDNVDAFSFDALADVSANDAPIDAPISDAGHEASRPIVPADASCTAAVQCELGMYCDYGDNGCGAEQEAGVCTSAAQCGEGDASLPVCACSGAVYPSTCAARRDGQDVSLANTCTEPASSIRCGYAFCPNTSFCIEHLGSDGGNPTFECAPLGGCVLGCLLCSVTTDACDGGVCGVANGGGIQVTCPN